MVRTDRKARALRLTGEAAVGGDISLRAVVARRGEQTRIEGVTNPDDPQHLEETGEVPNVGVHIEPAREKFYIR